MIWSVSWLTNLNKLFKFIVPTEYEIASKKLRLDMGILQFVQQRKRLAILGLQQQRRMASLDLLQRRGRELLSLLCSPSLELMVSWQRRCITTFQGNLWLSHIFVPTFSLTNEKMISCVDWEITTLRKFKF